MDRKPFKPEYLADVVRSWFQYHISVNRAHVLSEESIKYPVCDYLAQYTPDLKLEEKIEDLSGRDFDLQFQYDGIQYYFEFKFARTNYTKNYSEINRVFFDLIRLNSKSQEDHTECYFMMVGDKHPFITEFVNLGKEQEVVTSGITGDVPVQKKKRGRPNKYNTKGLYGKMFLFEEDVSSHNNVKNIVIDEDLQKIVDVFVKKYELSTDAQKRWNDTETFAKEYTKVNTVLIECSTDDGDGSRVGLGLWKIEHS